MRENVHTRGKLKKPKALPRCSSSPGTSLAAHRNAACSSLCFAESTSGKTICPPGLSMRKASLRNFSRDKMKGRFYAADVVERLVSKLQLGRAHQQKRATGRVFAAAGELLFGNVDSGDVLGLEVSEQVFLRQKREQLFHE